MPNKPRGEVTINLGGRDRLLRFSWGALARIEDETGWHRVDEIFQRGLLSSRVFLTILFHGLKPYEPDLTMEELEEIDEIDFNHVIEKVQDAYALYSNLPRRNQKKKKGAAKAEGKAPVGT